MEIIQINKFSNFHNEHNVFFSKTDYVKQLFNKIKDIKHNIILISGNSDYCITDELISLAPLNVKKWFCQNRLSDSLLLESIPIGLDNSVPCKVPDHGYVWGHAHEHSELLLQSCDVKPSKFIYANFSLETNKDRGYIAGICEEQNYITHDISRTHHEANSRSYQEYVNNILQHEAVVCPQGNNLGDNHRIYEVLYLGRIPIVFNKHQYKYIYHNFPVVFVDDYNKLKNEAWLRQQISLAKQKDIMMLDYRYWHNLIEKSIKELV